MRIYTYTLNNEVKAVASFHQTEARVYCSMKVAGKPPVTCYAGGGGYDRHGAALFNCLQKLGIDEADLGHRQEFSM